MTDTMTKALSLSLKAIHLPPVPSFWPISWGWWSLLITFFFTILLTVGLWRWRKHRLKAKKAAIALLILEKKLLTPSGAMEIVRQAVLSYYPRERVAHLSGENWLEFLDSQVKIPIFKTHEETWLAALYQKKTIDHEETLISQCESWLNAALPPKRGGRG